MICVIALFVFAVLGVFSARYRPLAREAFRCTFLKITLRPCETGLDDRIKSKLVSKLLPRAPRAARFVYKNFEVLSWAFTLLFFASMIYSAYSLYNLYAYGTCDPNTGVCLFNIKAPLCGCEGICQCGQLACEAPEYSACEGNCECQKGVCGIR
ncbi:MAG: hypothetical protein ABIA12_00010 [Candidatus Aenigmatarchaeota archaeon]